MLLRKSLPALATLLLALSGVIYAQQPQVVPQENMRQGREGLGEGRRHRKMGRHERSDFLRELNLTDEQQEQRRAIVQRHLGNTKAQREELFKLREKRIAGTFNSEDGARAQALHQEMRNAMETMRNEVEGTLTAEQRTRLEQLKSESKARHQEMRGRFRERRDAVPR